MPRKTKAPYRLPAWAIDRGPQPLWRITVNTRTDWHQTTLMDHHEVMSRMEAIAANHLSRYRNMRPIVVTATSALGDRLEISRWEPGRTCPACGFAL